MVRSLVHIVKILDIWMSDSPRVIFGPVLALIRHAVLKMGGGLRKVIKNRQIPLENVSFAINQQSGCWLEICAM
jgi:hypothetical protein